MAERAVTENALDRVLDWLSELVTVTLASANRSGGADADAGGELSGRVEGAGIHSDTCSKVASGAALEVTASEDDAGQILALGAGVGIDRTQGGRRRLASRGTVKPLARVLDWLSELVTVTLRAPVVAVELMLMLAVS